MDSGVAGEEGGTAIWEDQGLAGAPSPGHASLPVPRAGLTFWWHDFLTADLGAWASYSPPTPVKRGLDVKGEVWAAAECTCLPSVCSR